MEREISKRVILNFLLTADYFNELVRYPHKYTNIMQSAGEFDNPDDLILPPKEITDSHIIYYRKRLNARGKWVLQIQKIKRRSDMIDRRGHDSAKELIINRTKIITCAVENGYDLINDIDGLVNAYRSLLNINNTDPVG